MKARFEITNRSSIHKTERYIKRFDLALLYITIMYFLIMSTMTIICLIN
jgi:hypothetical protein